MESQAPQVMTELEQRASISCTWSDPCGHDHTCANHKNLASLVRQERQAVREEDAKLAEGSKPIKPGNVYRAQREQADRIAMLIRNQARKEQANG